MPIPANQVTHAQVIVYGGRSSQGSTTINTVNIFNFRRTSVVNPLSKTDLDTIFQSTIGDKIVLALNNTWSQAYNTVRWLNDAQDPPVNFTHVNAGAVTGDSMSSVAAVSILYRTALRGRSYKGGNHFGPLSESNSTAGTADILNAGAITLFGAVITGLGTPLVDASGNTWLLSIVSRKLSTLHKNPTVVSANDVTNILLNKRIGRLIRREVRSVF